MRGVEFLKDMQVAVPAHRCPELTARPWNAGGHLTARIQQESEEA